MVPPTSIEPVLLLDSPFLTVLIDVTLKATVLLLLAYLVNLAFSRASAAVRHRVWVTAFGGILILPVLVVCLPAWRLPMFGEVTLQEASEWHSTQKVEQSRDGSRSSVGDMEGQPSTTTRQPDFSTSPAIGGFVDQTGRDGLQEGSAIDVMPARVAVIWVMGVMVALAPLVLGMRKHRRIRRQSVPAEGSEWQELLRTFVGRLNLAQNVDVMQSDQISVPIVFGLRRACILLPDNSAQWPLELKRHVLLHELAHVRRRDVVLHIFCRVACSLYWFHPLAWYALRQLRREREGACDDWVLRMGESPSAYATNLLEIARACGHHRLGLATEISMARRTQLEGRLLSILDSRRCREEIRATFSRVSLGIAVSLTLVTAIPNLWGQLSTVGREGRQEGDVVLVEGRVVRPDGEAIAGATVRAVHEGIPMPLAEVTTSSDGRFSVSFSKSDVDYPHIIPDPWQGVAIAADANNLGPASINAGEVQAGKETVLTLVEDDVVVQGRILNRAGNPVQDASIYIENIYTFEENKLQLWLATVREGRGSALWGFVSSTIPPSATLLPKEIKTNAMGEFRLGGVGRDRLISLKITASGMATAMVDVVTRDIEPFLQIIEPSAEELGGFHTYGASFELTGTPTHPVIGTVRDVDTGEPLIGAVVGSCMHPSARLRLNSFVMSSTTDVNGRYRLDGLPMEKDSELLVVPTDQQPYFMTEKKVPDKLEAGAVTLDFELKRGIWVQGRVTDAATGRPVAARVMYYPFLANQHAAEYGNFRLREEGYSPRGSIDGWDHRYQTDNDGSYRVVAAAGRGVIAVKSLRMEGYLLGVGAEQIEGRDDMGNLQTYENCSPEFYDAFAEINPPDDADQVVCDLQLEPGETLDVYLIDSNQQAITGVRVQGRKPLGRPERLDSNHCQVMGLEIDKPRTLVLLHEQRKLGAVFIAKVGREKQQRHSVMLKPCSTVVGRLLDSKGNAVPGATVRIDLKMEDYSLMVRTDESGRFYCDTLWPEAEYSIMAETGALGYHTVAKTVLAVADTKINLGDVRLVSE
ncbi:MAG: M56 family metallopeptidase [Pirellulaceae bacterium]